jgi:hypothetical protein
MILVLNLVLCSLIIAMVVTPLARSIAASRAQTEPSPRRRQTARASAPVAARMRTPALGGSDR